METGKKINTLQTDNGLEFVNNKMKKIMIDEGIEHQTTVSSTPEQNGKAERENRTITEAARTMLLSKNIPKFMWTEAINTAVHNK
ncbi:copia protein [Lasius niger]|uniref:Copia protein n=1 Tax=Lasius niger TaxID=67767 RepID=A0A0J7KE27_LASNI|nr:copia protein [Lasius niger]